MGNRKPCTLYPKLKGNFAFNNSFLEPQSLYAIITPYRLLK